MTHATLAQLDARLTEIDDLLVKADLGDLHLVSSERSKLEAEAEGILQLLARAIGELQNLDPSKVYEERNGVRQLGYIAALTNRHQELHPNDPNAGKIISEAFRGLNDGTKTTQEAARMITSVILPSKTASGTLPKTRSRIASYFQKCLRRLHLAG